MANPNPNQGFPSRPYPGLSRGGPSGFQSASTPYNAQTPYGAPAQNPGSFGTAGVQPQLSQQQQQQQREAQQRLDRERAERAEREKRREVTDREAIEQLSDEHREEINEAFSLFDLDKDTYIDYHELKVALKALGFEVPKPELVQILQTHGISASILQAAGSGPRPQQQSSSSTSQTRPTFSGPSRLLLSHAAFVSIAAQKILERDPREEILRAFELFDVDGKGRIELEDLRRVARELGEGLQEEELVAMIEEFDVRGEGGIGREEFVGICMGG